MPAFEMKQCLILGATSGIGRGIATELIKSGRAEKVIITGRREEKLQEVQKELGGESKCVTYVNDISELEKIPDFVKKVTSEHPDLDFVLVVSGLQRGADFTKPSEGVDLKTLDYELTVNYSSQVHLATAFLPFLQEKSKSQQVTLGFTGSVLGIVPMSRCANYCATKAATHQFLLGLRKQLTKPFPNLKLLEILPPSTESELHDSHNQKDLSYDDKGQPDNVMPLKDFVKEVMEAFDQGETEIAPGAAKKIVNTVESARKEVLDSFP